MTEWQVVNMRVLELIEIENLVDPDWCPECGEPIEVCDLYGSCSLSGSREDINIRPMTPALNTP